MGTAVIIPAHNEQKHIARVVKKSLNYADEVIVVNDGSQDKTEKQALDAGATVLTHCTNLGKGAAVKTGCDYAYKKFTVLVLMDADEQHRPEDIPRFLEELQTHDIVFGEREKMGKAPLAMKLGNWFFTTMNDLLFSMPIQDTQSGFRAFKSTVYPQIRWESCGYTMESEMIFRARGLKYTEITIPRIYHDHAKGTTVLHGIPIFLSMLRWRLFGG